MLYRGMIVGDVVDGENEGKVEGLKVGLQRWAKRR